MHLCHNLTANGRARVELVWNKTPGTCLLWMQGPQLHSLDRTIPLGLKNLPSILQRGKNKTSKDLICGLQGPAQQAAHKGPVTLCLAQEGAWKGLPAASGLCSGPRTPPGCFPHTHRIGSARTRAHFTTGLTWLLTTGHCQGLQKDPLQVYSHVPCLCSSS